MTTLTLTEEDIGDIFVHWYEAQINGLMKCPGGPGEDQVMWLTDEFIKTAKIVLETKEEVAEWMKEINK